MIDKHNRKYKKISEASKERMRAYWNNPENRKKMYQRSMELIASNKPRITHIHHIDGDKNNNRMDNLEGTTSSTSELEQAEQNLWIQLSKLVKRLPSQKDRTIAEFLIFQLGTVFKGANKRRK